MTRSEEDRILHAPRWLAIFLAVFAVALAVATIYYYRSEGVSLAFGIALAFTLTTLVGLADALTTSVRLSADALTYMSNFRRRRVARSDIDKVTWEGGGGVFIQLHSGRWVKLPEVGNSQSVTNVIRAWIKRGRAEG